MLLTREVRPLHSNRKSNCIAIGQSSNNGSHGFKDAEDKKDLDNFIQYLEDKFVKF